MESKETQHGVPIENTYTGSGSNNTKDKVNRYRKNDKSAKSAENVTQVPEKGCKIKGQEENIKTSKNLEPETN